MPLIERPNWSNWKTFQDLNQNHFSEIPSKPGAYIIASNKDIQRFHGFDTEGIIDIGESLCLRSRIINFWRCAKDIDHKVSGHMAGWRFAYLKYQELLPLEKLFVSYIICESKSRAEDHEREQLENYLNKHKELPPLNYKHSWPK